MKELEWYAFDSKSAMGSKDLAGLEYINIMSNDLIERVKKCIKKNFKYEEIREAVRSELIHRYWGRSEYEVVVSNWVGYDFETKIDVWYQLEPNLDRITEYLIRELAPRKCKEILNVRVNSKDTR